MKSFLALASIFFASGAFAQTVPTDLIPHPGGAGGNVVCWANDAIPTPPVMVVNAIPMETAMVSVLADSSVSVDGNVIKLIKGEALIQANEPTTVILPNGLPLSLGRRATVLAVGEGNLVLAVNMLDFHRNSILFSNGQGLDVGYAYVAQSGAYPFVDKISMTNFLIKEPLVRNFIRSATSSAAKRLVQDMKKVTAAICNL